MELIYIVDLTSGSVREEPYDLAAQGEYGCGLAHRLLERHTSPDTDRLDPQNALILVPGLLAGCPAPSAGRMTILAKGGKTSVHICNVTGNMPQKLGSLNICALVIKGADPAGNAVIHIDAEGVRLLHMPELKGKYTDEVLSRIKERFGRDAAVMGTGIAGDMRLPLSTVFCTYPDGNPEYNCPRNGFGDIPGSKGLRAVVVSGQSYFARECGDRAALLTTGKQLAAQILNNEICSSALPSYGSITLIQLLQNGGLTVQHNAPPKQTNPTRKDGKINYCCAPMCVIGCLNRHSAGSGEHYDSPDQSELATALKNCFDIEDGAFLRRLQHRLRSLCLVSPEFVTAARSYFRAANIEFTKERILSLVDQIEQGTEIGALVASRTEGIAAAYPGRADLLALKDRPAIADESSFQVQVSHRSGPFQDVKDLDMLYYQIFVLENLGICLFASFALVNNDDALTLLAELVRFKTGMHGVEADDLIQYAKQCSERELDYIRLCGAPSPTTNIPAFTKVLYRYFSKVGEPASTQS